MANSAAVGGISQWSDERAAIATPTQSIAAAPNLPLGSVVARLNAAHSVAGGSLLQRPASPATGSASVPSPKPSQPQRRAGAVGGASRRTLRVATQDPSNAHALSAQPSPPGNTSDAVASAANPHGWNDNAAPSPEALSPRMTALAAPSSSATPRQRALSSSARAHGARSMSLSVALRTPNTGGSSPMQFGSRPPSGLAGGEASGASTPLLGTRSTVTSPSPSASSVNASNSNNTTNTNVIVYASANAKERAPSSHMVAKAARESNLSSSLTGYIQNQLSLYAKRGHAREVLQMLERRQKALTLSLGGGMRAASQAAHAQAVQASSLDSIAEATDHADPHARSSSWSSFAKHQDVRPAHQQTEEQRLFHQQWLAHNAAGKAPPSLHPGSSTSSSSMPPPAIRLLRAHTRLASEVFAPLPTGRPRGDSGGGWHSRQGSVSSSVGGIAELEEPAEQLVLPSGSSNPLLPPLTKAKLTLPSEHFEVTASGSASARTAHPPTDALARRAAQQYSVLASQAAYLRAREEKEAETLLRSSGGSVAAAVTGSYASASAAGDVDRYDRWGRKFLGGLATDAEKAARFEALAQTHADPAPFAPALRSISTAYASLTPRDYRPAVAAPPSAATSITGTGATRGAERNAALDYDVIKGRRDWTRLLGLAREEMAAKDRNFHATDDSGSSYQSGSQSARPAKKPLNASFAAGVPPAISSLHNPPLATLSLRRHRGSLAHKLNSSRSGRVEELEARMQRHFTRQAQQEAAQVAAQLIARQNERDASAALAALVTPFSSAAHGGSGGAHPPLPHPSNVYVTAGFSSADFSGGSGSLSIGALGSYSATGGFQRLALGTTASLAAESALASMQQQEEATKRWRAEVAHGVEGAAVGSGLPAASPRSGANGGPSSKESSVPVSSADQLLGVGPSTYDSLLDFTDRNGSTPLFHCGWEGFVSIMTLLLEHGANPNVRNVRRHTAMDMAVERSHMDCVKVLLRYGSDSTRTEAKQARNRCRARIGATYAAWCRRMQSAGFMSEAGALLSGPGVSLPCDAESLYFYPVHAAQRKRDRDILALFAHTVFYPPAIANPSFVEEEEQEDTHMHGMRRFDESKLPPSSSSLTQRTIRVPAMAHLTREARLARREKLRATRAEAAKHRVRFLVAAGLAPSASGDGGLGEQVGREAAARLAKKAAVEQAALPKQRSILHLLPRVRDSGAASSSNQQKPTAGVEHADGNANELDTDGKELDDASVQLDGLVEYEQDLYALRSLLSLQRSFFESHGRELAVARARDAERYSPLEAWIDQLELYHAVCQGRLSDVEAILLHHPEHSAFVAHGASMLYHAAWHGHYAVARALIAAAAEHRLVAEMELRDMRAKRKGASAGPRGNVLEEDEEQEMLEVAQMYILADGTEQSLDQRPSLYYDPLRSAPGNEGTIAGEDLPYSLWRPRFLDVNFLCVDALRSTEESGLSGADRAAQASMRRRAELRQLRRTLQAKKEVAESEKRRERERQRELNLSDSDEDSSADESTGAKSQAAMLRARIAAQEAQQREEDDAIDSATALPPAMQIWHKWLVDPRKWNNVRRRAMVETQQRRASERAATAVAAGKADWALLEESRLASQLALRECIEAESLEEAWLTHQLDDRARRHPEDSHEEINALAQPRFETAIYAAIKRRHYRVALLLQEFGALSPYSHEQLHALCDVQLRARALMQSIRAQDYASLSSLLSAAAAVPLPLAPLGLDKVARPVLAQVLAYQEPDGANALLLAIQHNDLRAMEIIKHAAIHQPRGTGSAGGSARAASGGPKLLQKLLTSVKDRLGYSALDTSLQQQQQLLPSDAPVGVHSSGEAMTSFLLAQGGLKLATASILDLILQHSGGGDEANGDKNMNHGAQINYAGVDALKKLIQRAAGQFGGGREGATHSAGSNGSGGSSLPAVSEEPFASLDSPRSRGAPVSPLLLSPGIDGPSSLTAPELVNFRELYSALDSNKVRLPEAQLNEMRELLREVEGEQGKARSAAARAAAAAAKKRPRAHSVSAASNVSGSPRLSRRFGQHAEVESDVTEMEAVPEGADEGGEIASHARDAGADGGGGDSDEDAMADETRALQSALQALESAAAAKQCRIVDQQRATQTLRDGVARGEKRSGGVSVSSSDDETEQHAATTQASRTPVKRKKGSKTASKKRISKKKNAKASKREGSDDINPSRDGALASSVQGLTNGSVALLSTLGALVSSSAASSAPLAIDVVEELEASRSSAVQQGGSDSDSSATSDSEGSEADEEEEEEEEDAEDEAQREAQFEADTAPARAEEAEAATVASMKRQMESSSSVQTMRASPSALALASLPPVVRRAAVIEPIVQKDDAAPSSAPGSSLRSRSPPLRVATPPPPPDILPLLVRCRLLWMMDDIESEAVAVESSTPSRSPHGLLPTEAAASSPLLLSARIPAHVRKANHLRKVSFGSGVPRSISTASSPLASSVSAASPVGGPRSSSLSSSSPLSPARLIDVTMIKWNNLLKVNPFIEPLLGVDFPHDQTRNTGHEANAREAQAALSAAAGADSGVQSPTADRASDSMGVPLTATTSLAPGWKRASQSSGSLPSGAVPAPSSSSLPALSSPRGGGFRRFGIGFASTSPPLGSRSLSILPPEQSDPPSRTVTEAGWLEAWRRLAREKGIATVQRAMDEFARISRVAREERAKQAALQQAEQDELDRLQASLLSDRMRGQSNHQLNSSRVSHPRRMLTRSLAATAGAVSVRFDEPAFRGGALAKPDEDAGGVASTDAVMSFVTPAMDGPSEEGHSTHSARSPLPPPSLPHPDAPLWPCEQPRAPGPPLPAHLLEEQQQQLLLRWSTQTTAASARETEKSRPTRDAHGSPPARAAH